ncbi:mannose-1-phosphate guanylyltransferase [Catalinimonas alkaloidigena]|uniref:mannose-1-phosphate guanylyltransferase n=1 Tax=Catalinimonas alkaloidigena TaxID=1075417 RepID=UPI00240629BA|nr:mannose-1-phosphate guanylyltransferase [Catalinimonas alkaloidigena]MDF9797369.1 mannose-1-phosphate guanylyltransferase [Catalinimonas alkaloidigena]
MTQEDTYVLITLFSSNSTNFWPFSRKHLPKQFLDLFGNGRSLLQLTYERSKGICPEKNIFISVPKEYHSTFKNQLPDFPEENILTEPVRRNSAPCIAYASYKIKKLNKNAVIVVCPASHAVFGEIAYVRDVRKAVEVAQIDKNALLIMGIKPHKAETSYAYIQYHFDHVGLVKKVKSFMEKPQSELAKLFLESGDFAWNTKIFVWHVDAILEAFEFYLPDVAEVYRECMPYFFTEDEDQSIIKAYSVCKNVSISTAILEKADNVFLIMGNFDWSSVSSWQSLYDLKDPKEEKNVVEANALMMESKNCYVKSDSKKLIVVHGLRNYLVADSEDVLLIYPKDKDISLKSVMNDVKNNKGDKYL